MTSCCWRCGGRRAGSPVCGLAAAASTSMSNGGAMQITGCQVTGVVTRDRGLVIVVATEVALAAEPPATSLTLEPAVEAPPPRPVDVVFSAPTADETDVSPASVVRVQFSRGLRESSLAGQIRISYVGATPSDPPIAFKTSYDAASRAVRIAFERPLESARSVKVELLPGITAFDGGPLALWTLTFTVSAR